MIQKPSKLNVSQPKEVKRFKVLVLGDGGVGKSSILDRFINNTFDPKYRATIAIDYKNKTVDLQKESVQLNFWDFSGHPEFYEVRNEFYKDANAIVLVLDVTLRRSLDGLDMWLREAHEMGVQGIPTVVVGNKKDMPVRAVSENDAYNWAKTRQFDYFEVSASQGTGLEELFKSLSEKLAKQ
ncbi:hypothetical protein ABPG72_010644 [Tetrahymena utriculariae]